MSERTQEEAYEIMEKTQPREAFYEVVAEEAKRLDVSRHVAYLWWLIGISGQDEEWGDLSEGTRLWIARFDVDDGLVEMFPELAVGEAVYVATDDQGFVYGLGVPDALNYIGEIERFYADDEE